MTSDPKTRIVYFPASVVVNSSLLNMLCISVQQSVGYNSTDPIINGKDTRSWFDPWLACIFLACVSIKLVKKNLKKLFRILFHPIKYQIWDYQPIRSLTLFFCTHRLVKISGSLKPSKPDEVTSSLCIDILVVVEKWCTMLVCKLKKNYIIVQLIFR